MTDTKHPDWRSDAVADYRQRRVTLIHEYGHMSEQVDDLQVRVNGLLDQMGSLVDKMKELDDAARVFGLDINVQELPEPERAFMATPSPKRGRLFKDVALEMLEMAYPNPLKAAQVKAEVEKELDTTFHQKTAGMTLYRLAKTGKVRREGHKWFFVPEEERHDRNEESPDEGPSGLFDRGPSNQRTNTSEDERR